MGCGKTYLIDNELTETLGNKAHVMRISLFGITSIEGIHVAVRQAWISECNKDKKWKNAVEKVQQGKEAVGKLEFLPEWLRGIATTDWQSFVEVKNTIEGKPVILVFDDLERCCLDSVDVLGVINDYCENQKFHTIIVANQDKIKLVNKSSNGPIDIEINEFESGNQEKPIKKIVAKANMQSQKDVEELSYNEIKEKIIHRTIQYVPDYAKIVHAVIDKMKYQDDAYEKFVKDCEEGILELFAPDRNTYNESQKSKRPHNIRSLKCAIRDFYRVFGLLESNDFEDIDKWFSSFISYVIAYKANIAKEGRYGTSFSDKNVQELYPAFKDQYMVAAIKNWILHGVWDEGVLVYELGFVQAREKSETPTDIVRTHRIMDIDESIIIEGFPYVVEMAYAGELSLDEYVYFIQNSCWGRRYEFEFPVVVEWQKIQQGLNKSIKKLLDSRKEGQQIHSVISVENKEYFTEEEWNTYCIIEEFREGNLIMFSNNKKLYIEWMKEDSSTVFFNCQNKRFNMFDEEMAIATANAYAKGNNSEKHEFLNRFYDMWKLNIASHDIIKEASLTGFCKLFELLNAEIETLKNENKVFAIRHTENFMKKVDELIQKMKDIKANDVQI